MDPDPLFYLKEFFILTKRFFNNILNFINATSDSMHGNLNGHRPVDLILLIRIIEGFLMGKLNERD